MTIQGSPDPTIPGDIQLQKVAVSKNGVDVGVDWKDTVITVILNTIRTNESGNYNQHYHDISSGINEATGAYQIMNSVWPSWASSSGVPGATAYPAAYLAPPSIQDAVAAWRVKQILDGTNGDLAAVPIMWYVPAAYGNPIVTTSEGVQAYAYDCYYNDSNTGKPTLIKANATTKITVRQYATKWIKSGPFGFSQPGAIFNVVPGIGVAKNVINTVTTPIKDVASFVTALGKSSTWVRVLKVVGGSALVGFGLYQFVGDSKAVDVVKGVVKNASATA